MQKQLKNPEANQLLIEANLAEEKRICKYCVKEFPISEFSITSSDTGRVYRRRQCKECQRAYDRGRNKGRARKREVKRKKDKAEAVLNCLNCGCKLASDTVKHRRKWCGPCVRGKEERSA